jgi:hypothetical protein
MRTQQANVSRTTSETGRVAGWQLLPICRRLEEELREAQPHNRVVPMDDVVLRGCALDVPALGMTTSLSCISTNAMCFLATLPLSSHGHLISCRLVARFSGLDLGEQRLTGWISPRATYDAHQHAIYGSPPRSGTPSTPCGASSSWRRPTSQRPRPALTPNIMMHALLAETLAHQLAMYEPRCTHMLKVIASRTSPLAGSV